MISPPGELSLCWIELHSLYQQNLATNASKVYQQGFIHLECPP
ncbi:hypothetical protein AK973_4546 [Pseudomonas brassicacearum]|nr:hypothetical protein AK973_4546 [Pseudomonas brassicacearum]